MSSLKKLMDTGVVSTASSEDIDLDNKTYTFYAGFDPTADSLHVGHLFVLVTMRRLQQLGHKPIAVVGGATGMIGDPSGRSKERVLLSEEIIEKNIKGLSAQIEKFINTSEGGVIVNNYDWFKGFGFIQFLRDVGKVFRLSEMLGKESVQKRLSSDEGISFTEFTYQILQSYDFLHLFRTHDCNMQIGGSDQWGNISAGITLIRKETGKESFALTLPLIKNSSGEKFGKSEGQNVWLDPNQTSPYNFYQFWMNTNDADVIQYLYYFTFLGDQEIERLKSELVDSPEKRSSQKALAYEITTILHGKAEADKAVQASEVLFGGSIKGLGDADLKEIFSDVPSIEIQRQELDAEGLGLLSVITRAGLAPSNGKARKLIQQGGIYLNNERVSDDRLMLTETDLGDRSTMVLRAGRKKYCLIQFQ